MTAIHVPQISGAGPQRRSLIDWLSVSRSGCSDREMRELQKAVGALVRDVTGYGETEPMKSAGNFGEGHRFKRFGAEIKLTTHTQAELNHWHEQGRCVGTINFTARGGTGIGSLPVDSAVSLLSSLRQLGFDSPTRVDCTIDLFDDTELSLSLMKQRLESLQWRIPRRKLENITYIGPLIDVDGRPQAASLYLGSRTAPTRVTVYDKAVQMEQDRPWLRFECRCQGEGASWAFQELLEASDAAFESGNALLFLDRAIVGIVRSEADIRDVTAFNDVKRLPKNWMRSPLSVMPDLLAPVFGQIAPLELDRIRIDNGLASRIRHVQHSGGKTIWQICLLQVAAGHELCNSMLQLGMGAAFRLSPEDFEELAKQSGRTPAEIEQAEVDLLNLVCERFNYDERILFSDKQAVRAEAAVTLRGV